MRGYLLVLILLLPSSYALDNSQVETQYIEDYNEIMQINDSKNMKQELVASLIYRDNNFANHAFVSEWNRNIVFDSAPDNTNTVSKSYIKNAWLKIISVMPSVYDNKLLSNGSGEVMSDFNYNVQMPSGTAYGDCRTTYSLARNDAELSIELNGNEIGTERIVLFHALQDMNFDAELLISITIKVDHYKPETYCCSYWKRGCHRYCERCVYRYSDSISESQVLTDNFFAEYYNPSINYDFTVINEYENTTKAHYFIHNATYARIDFPNSFLSESDYYYTTKASLEPYDVFTLIANKHSEKDFSNLKFEFLNNTYTFYLPSPQNCSLSYRDHFSSYAKPCSLDFDAIELEIKTDKIGYDDNELINAEIEPKNTPVKISYGNNTFIAQNSFQLTVQYPANKITASVGDVKTDKIISVKKGKKLNVLLNISIFSVANYILLVLIKKYGFVLGG